MEFHKIVRFTLLILLVALFIYLISYDIYYITEGYLLYPAFIIFRVLLLISIIGVALDQLFGSIIAIILNILGLISIILFAIFYLANVDPEADLTWVVFYIILRGGLIALAFLMISTRESSSVPKYQASGYIEATEQYPNTPPKGQQQVNKPNKFCPNCGASIQGSFCTNCGTKI